MTKRKNKIRKLIRWILRIEDEIPSYPSDFAIVDYTPIALQNNIRTEQNKIIYRYFFDRFGNNKIKKYRYSKERINSFKEVLNIPIYDKTKKEQRFPVFSRTLPSEVEYER